MPDLRIPSGYRKSQVRIPGGGGGIQATILPSQTGCRLGPEAEACARAKTTLTREQYLRGPKPT